MSSEYEVSLPLEDGELECLALHIPINHKEYNVALFLNLRGYEIIPFLI
jgi:hypothetical protein